MALADTAKLVVALVLDDKLSGPLGRVQSGLGQMGKGVGQVAGGIAKLGAVAGVAAVGGIALAAKSAIDFEDAFAGIKKTVDETDLRAAGLSFEDLSVSIRKMAREIPIAATDLARIGEAAGALGIAAQDIDDFTKVVAELSVTTNLTSDEAATALGQLGTILHLTGGDFEDFADSLVALGNAGASTEDQIIDIAARFAAAGSAAGLSKEDILAFASATASMGIDAESAGSSLSRTFNNITTSIGTGSREAKAFAESMGLSAKEFKEQWDKNASGTFVEFLRVLGKLDKFKQAELLEKVGITGVRDIAAVQLMTQNLEFFNDQIEIANNASGALSVEAQKKFDTVASHIQLMKNNLTDVGITIGNELLPIISDLTKDFADFINQPGTQKGIANFAKDLAGGVRSLVDELKGTDFSGIIGGMKLAAEVAKGAFDAFRSLPEPIQQLAIAALVANKVSGGAIGSIAKGLGNILLGSLRTITAGNVTVIGANVTGGGGAPVGGAPVASTTSLLKSLVVALGGVAIGGAIASPVLEETVAPARKFEETQFNELTSRLSASNASLKDIDAAIAALEAQYKDIGSNQIDLLAGGASELASIFTGQKGIFSTLNDQLASLRAQRADILATRGNTADSARWTGLANSQLATLNAKKFDPTVNVNVAATANISVSNIERTLTSFRIAGSTTVGGFTESAF